MKLIKTTLLLAALSLTLTGCQLGVLSLDIGMGFEAGSYVISE
jgi:hypothetical protein